MDRFLGRVISPVPDELREKLKLLLSYHELNKRDLNEVLVSVALNQNVPVIEYLLSIGYRIDVIDDWGRTLLHLAMSCPGEEDISILQIDSIFFKCKEDKNYKAEGGLSHLHVACAAGLLDVVKHFVERGEDINARCDSVNRDRFYDYAALHFAVRFKRQNVILYLLQNGADLGSIDSASLTPLHVACEDHSLALGISFEDCGTGIIEILLDHGNSINVQDEKGRTPIMFLFIDHLCKSFNHDSNFEKYHCQNDRKLRENRRRLMEKFHFLLRSGANLHVKTKTGGTVLHYALENLWSAHKPDRRIDVHFSDEVVIEIIQILLDKGVDVNVADNTGRTALEIAVSGLSIGAVNVLLSHGADVNVLKFDRTFVQNEEKFFVCSNQAPPSLQAVEICLDIMELLSDYDWIMRLQDGLHIMEFLVWTAGNINLDCYDEFENAERVLNYGTAIAIKEFWKKMLELEYPDELSDHCMKHFRTMYEFQFYIDEELKKKFNFLVPRGLSEFQVEEVEFMKAVKSYGETTLHNIMAMRPDKIYRNLKDKEYRWFSKTRSFGEKCFFTPDIVKGHFAKCLIRKYISELMQVHIRPVVFPRIPHLCFALIMDYLTNENLFNLYSSTLYAEKKENQYNYIELETENVEDKF